jgi:hypothetical protein
METKQLSTVEVLKIARDKIGVPGAFCKGVYGKDADGHSIGGFYADELKNAVTFCAIGAVAVAMGVGGGDAGKSEAVRILAKVVANVDDRFDQHSAVAHWNNDPARTQEEVVAGFDKAIALAEAS